MSAEYLYITSHPTKTYPQNLPHTFQNHIRPLVLNPNKSYELGLANLFMPKDRKIIQEGDPSYGAKLFVRFKNYDETLDSNDIPYDAREEKEYLPTRSLFTSETNESLVNTINSDIANTFHKFYVGPHSLEIKQFRQALIDNLKIIQYDPQLNRSFITEHKEGEEFRRSGQAKWQSIFGSVEDIEKISITFNELLAEALGFNASEEYNIYSVLRGDMIDSNINQYGSKPPRRDGGVNNILVYCDLPERTRFASEFTNIIDVLPVETGTVKIKSIFYKRLKPTQEITDVSILLRCQRGRPILFAEGSDVLAILHIRERTESQSI